MTAHVIFPNLFPIKDQVSDILTSQLGYRCNFHPCRSLTLAPSMQRPTVMHVPTNVVALVASDSDWTRMQQIHSDWNEAAKFQKQMTHVYSRAFCSCTPTLWNNLFAISPLSFLYDNFSKTSANSSLCLGLSPVVPNALNGSYMLRPAAWILLSDMDFAVAHISLMWFNSNRSYIRTDTGPGSSLVAWSPTGWRFAHPLFHTHHKANLGCGNSTVYLKWCRGLA